MTRLPVALMGAFDEWRVEQGDSLALLLTLPEASVDLVLTDPPYSSGGLHSTARTGATGAKYGSERLHDFGGDQRDQRSWALWSALWLGLALRAAKPGAAIVMFADYRQVATAIDAVQVGGWTYRGLSGWKKPRGTFRSFGGRPEQDLEFIIHGSLGVRPITSGDGTGPSTIEVAAPRGEARVHQTQKPVALLREWVRMAPPGGVVLDPFAGSGSTGVAALLEGRRFIGFELTQHYAEVARERLAGIDPVGAPSTMEQPSLFGGGD